MAKPKTELRESQAESSGGIALVDEPPPPVDVPVEYPPEEPLWVGIEAEKKRHLDERFLIVPGSWLSRNFKAAETTGRDLVRMGHRIERLEALGIIARIKAQD